MRLIPSAIWLFDGDIVRMGGPMEVLTSHKA